jgi:hypothetical protein
VPNQAEQFGPDPAVGSRMSHVSHVASHRLEWRSDDNACESQRPSLVGLTDAGAGHWSSDAVVRSPAELTSEVRCVPVDVQVQ